MKKGIIICVIVVLIAAVAGGLGFYFYTNSKDDKDTKKSNETSQSKEKEEEVEEKEEKKETKKEASVDEMAEEFGAALESEKKFTEFLKDNLDFKTYQAMNSIDMDTILEDVESLEDYKTSFEDGFEKSVKNLDEDEIDEDDIIELVIEEGGIEPEEALTVDKVGKKKECKIFPVFDRYDVTFVNEDEDETEIAMLLYKGKLVAYIETETLDQYEKMLSTLE